MIQVSPVYQENSLQNFSYIIELKDNQCFVVDPFDGDIIFDVLVEKKLKLKSIIITHEHVDHFCGVERLKELTHVQEIWFSQIASEKIPFKATKILQDGDIMYSSLGSSITVFATPWHTFWHISLEIKNEENISLIVWDTLFSGGVGNVRSGSVDDLFISIQKISKYPQNTKTYSGHDYLENNLRFTLSLLPNNTFAQEILKKRAAWFYFTTIEEEKQINLFLRLENHELRSTLFWDIRSNISQIEVFRELRKRRNDW